MNETALPFVTFVIPARNEESNIEKCILGIKGLDYPEDRYEIIVADGCSGDGTAEIARSLGARVISNEKIIQSAARNIGAKNAKGELVAFLDADNVLEKDWLRKAVDHFQDPKVAAVGNLPGVNDKAGWIGKVWHFHIKSRYPGRRAFTVNWLDSASLIYVREIFDKIGGFDESIRFTEDVDIGFRARQQGYTIIFDPGLRSVQMSYLKSLPDFIKRQVAGGRSIIHLIRGYGFKNVWKITVFIAIYAICLLGLAAGLFIDPLLSLLSLASMVALAVLVAVKCCMNERSYDYLLPLTFLVFLSGILRAIALVLPEKK